MSVERSFLCLGLLAAVSAFAIPTDAQAEELRWVLMPVRADHPPPADPTLLRLSTPLARVWSDAVGGKVRLASREQRDENCRDEGWRCPDEVAAVLDVDRVVSWQLSEDHDRLDILVYVGRTGIAQRAEIDCDWDEGKLSCDRESMARFAATLVPRPLKPEAVFEAFEALTPGLQRCARKVGSRRGAQVVFRVGPDGHARDVRIEPRKWQRQRGFECMARTVEGLYVAPFSGSVAGPFRFALPDRPRTR